MKPTSHKSVPSKVIAVPSTISPELAEVVAQPLPSIDIPKPMKIGALSKPNSTALGPIVRD